MAAAGLDVSKDIPRSAEVDDHRAVGNEKAAAVDIGDVDTGERDRGTMPRLGDLHLGAVGLQPAHTHDAIDRQHANSSLFR